MVVASCTSTPELSKDVTMEPTVDPEVFRQWEDETRDRADDLMAEAQRLQAEGNATEAVSRADEALCEVLDTPVGYEPPPEYIEYLAELIDEANELEAELFPFDEDLEDTEEIAFLPPIDIYVNDAAAEEPEDDGPLPNSDFPLILNETVEGFLTAMSLSQRIQEPDYPRPRTIGRLPADDPGSIRPGRTSRRSVVPSVDRIRLFFEGVLARPSPRNVAVHLFDRPPLRTRGRLISR